MAYMRNKPLLGLHPVQNRGGTAPQIHHYAVSSTYATAIGEGGIAIKAATGVQMDTATPTPSRGTVVGVFASNNPAYVSGGTKHQTTVAIYDDPNQVFTGTFNAAISAAQAIEYIGQFVGCVTNTYSATYDQAMLRLSTVTSVESDTAFLQIVGVSQPVSGSTAGTTWNSVTTYGQLQVKVGPGYHFWDAQVTGATDTTTNARPT